MGSLTRKIKRNMAEKKYGVRACTERGVKKKLALLEKEIAEKTEKSFGKEGSSTSGSGEDVS